MPEGSSANTASSARPALEIVGVTHRYGKTLALQPTHLALPAGHTIGVVGPDGVGKSTLLSLIAGVKRLQAGHIRVLGLNIGQPKDRAHLAPRIAFMPQGLGRNLYPTLSVEENIDFFARLFGHTEMERTSRTQRLMDATGLTPFRDRAAGKLSGGMKQKLGLCCALVHDPDLLILDEPTTGVDPLSRRQFWTLVESLRRARPGMTVIVATAYMEEAEQFDYLVAMNDGQILVFDRTDAVLQRTPAHTLEAAFIDMLPPEQRGITDALVIPAHQPSNGTYAIEATGLTRRFGDFVAVRDVNFAIERGEIFGFLGSNGCGKTTTMKMLTGLLDISSGEAKLLGNPIDPKDLKTRLKVGYMSQAFSLYEELTVQQNLMLHAKIYGLEGDAATNAVRNGLTHFELIEHAESRPLSMSLGMRQRLQLAAACLHRPEVLILDEPTSGVDPAARDMFWRYLIKLSREDQVTIFISTHFMNEAERCDRISLMHRGQVLAIGKPQDLCTQQNAPTLESAFIAYLEAADDTVEAAAQASQTQATTKVQGPNHQAVAFKTHGGLNAWTARMWAFARREAVELLRDRIRLAFAVIGPIILLLAAALSISFDIERVGFAVLDRDQTYDSRQLIENFAGSHYFIQKSPLQEADAINRRLQQHDVSLIIEIPPNFGRDLQAGRHPEVGLYIDGAQPFTAENVRGYARGILLEHAAQFMRENTSLPSLILPARIEPRFTYNQDFRSIYASTPGILMLCLIIVPAMLTALGVVREKEMGSIINLYASPASIGEFLVGKQLPYIGLAMISYLTLVILAVALLKVPLKGSFIGLSLGALCFVFATTALGLLISAFLQSQVAASFASAIICLIPSVNFSGLLYPVSTLTGASEWIGLGFPASWFQLISLGTFTKGLGISSFWSMYVALCGFGLSYLVLARLAIRKQEN